MLVYAGPDLRQVAGDVLLRAILRSDLAPVPQTVEIMVRDDPDFRAQWAVGQIIAAGRDGARFKIVKSGVDGEAGLIQDDRKLGAIAVTGLLESCAPIASPLQRAVIRQGATLGGIYRACGANVRIEQDFVVPRFCAFTGDVPSLSIPIALQEEGAAMTYKAGRLSFRRLADLSAQEPIAELPDATDRSEQSEFKEMLAVPFAFSAAPDGSIIFGRRESGRAAFYSPRTDQRVLNNLSAVLIRRRKLRAEFSGDIMAGDCLKVAGKSLIVITAAHVFDSTGTAPEQYSLYWLGEYVR
ncbi:hypothetical protein [Nevskia ramosa]|uniref:hypothetical protein n=1 Tax=Nevskia ramosa TaxID=64002 RepID=UPI003D1022F2